MSFYFSRDIVDSFAQVAGKTETMDALLWNVRSQEGAQKVYDAGLAVYESLRAWNATVMPIIKGGGESSLVLNWRQLPGVETELQD